MKRQEDFTVGAALALTAVFAIMGIFSLTIDDSNPIVYIPFVGVVAGLILAFKAKSNADDKKARKKQQDNFAQTLDYDDCYGNGELKLYFNSSKQEAIVCATTIDGTSTQVVKDFIATITVETDSNIVSYDATHNKLLRANSNKGTISLKEFNLNYTFKKWGILVKTSTPAVKAYNKYAFITDDINKFIVIVSPYSINAYQYSDIVSISYEENGNNVYNKSLGGAVVGGLLFGGVGAIVGSNAAKTTQNKKIEKMAIKILLNSTTDPTLLLDIYKAGIDGAILETKKEADRMFYEGLMKEVSGIKDIFSIIMDIVEKNRALQSPKVNSVVASNSIADELIKLSQLRVSGILSEEEFQAQKAKLLQ